MQMVLSSAYRSPIIMRLAFFVALLWCVAVQAQFDINFCNETTVAQLGCHFLAECTYGACTCPRGTVDTAETEGTHCNPSSFVSRLVLEYDEGTFNASVVLPIWGELLANASLAVVEDANGAFTAAQLGFYADAKYFEDHAVYHVTTFDGKEIVTLSGLFKIQLAGHAKLVSAKLRDLHPDAPAATSLATVLGGANRRVWGPQKYNFYLPTTSSYYEVGATGLDVNDVYFEANCLDSGCWVIDITYTMGSGDAMNVLYIPIADGSGTLVDAQTKEPEYFPCGSNQWDTATLIEQTACCMSHFEDKYRVMQNFSTWLVNEAHVCPNTTSGDRPWETDVTQADWTNAPTYGTLADQNLDQLPGNFVTGHFSGMTHSYVDYTGVVDYTLGIHQARMYMDEHEVRTLAAQREGTLQVQYTLDLFVGIAEFSPTSTKFMDSAMKQVEIHLEKSDFFTVAQHSSIGPGPPTVCCGPECLGVYEPPNSMQGVYQGYDYCPEAWLGKINGCVIVEGPFEYGVDPCATCPPDRPDCVLGPLECQNFEFQGVYYMFPNNLTTPPQPGNVTFGGASGNGTFGGGDCCIQVYGSNPVRFYPADCNKPEIGGCESIYVREQDENTKYPIILKSLNESLWDPQYNSTFIACCTQYWETLAPDCSKYENKISVPAKKKFFECSIEREAYLTERCFKCHPDMPACDCNRVSCGGADPVSNFNLRLNEVLDPTDPSGSEVLQYLQVSFTTGYQFQPAPSTGAVALNSIIVAKNEFYETAVFTQACGGTGSIYETNGNRGKYADRWDNDCAPDNEVCQKIVNIADNFVMINIPLGPDFFFRNESTITGDINIYVEFVVTLQKISREGLGTFASNVKLAYPLVPGGVNTWCQSEELQTDLAQVANVDLLVGSAMNQTEWSRLMLFTDIAGSKLNPANATEFATVSIESGLMTLVIKGNDTYFTLPGTLNYKLELEDVMTLHIMENGDDMWTQIKNLMTAQDNGRAAFDVVTDRWGHKAVLEPSAALMRYCTFSPRRSSVDTVIPSACIARRDIRARLPVKVPGADYTALELVSDSTVANIEAQSVDFLETILGQSDYTARLAKAFRPLIRDFWGVNDRYIRAWWINPGYEWTPSSTNGGEINKFTISQKLVMFALVNLNEGFESRRSSSADGDDAVYAGKRMLLASTSADKGNGVGASTMQFPISAKDVVCQALECDMEAMTVWKIDFSLTDEETCYEKEGLTDALRGSIKRHLKASAGTSKYESVQVLDVVVDRAGVQCNGASGARRALKQNGGTASANTIILFADKTSALNVDEVLGATDDITMTGFRAADTMPAGITVIDTNQPRTPAPTRNPSGNDDPDTDVPVDKTDDEDDDNRHQITIIMAAVFGAVGSVLSVVSGVMAWKFTKDEELEISIVEALNPQEFKEKAGNAPLNNPL